MIENIAHKNLTLKRIDTPQDGVETSNRMGNKV